MRILIFVIAIAFSVVVSATEEKTATNTTAGVAKTKDSRGKRNLNFGNYGASRRNDGYNYAPSGYNYENNYIGGGVAPATNNFQQNYPEAPEPIIEIIIQDNNETLPLPEPIIPGKKKKEQVQVFYVKYHKDEKTGLVIHDPIPALTPHGHNNEEEEYEEPIQIVTPIPQLQRSTTLRTIIRPDSMQYESDSGVHVTFGSAHNHHSKSDNRIHDEEKVESAIRPVIQLPQNRIGPVHVSNKEKRQPQQIIQNQGRIVNGPPVNFHQSPQPLAQSPSFARPHGDFNPQNNFVAPPNQGQLSHQLSLPSQDPSKPFHPNVQLHHHQQPQPQQNLRPQPPQPIPVHQAPPQFGHPQLGHQQFNQPPQRIQPNAAPLQSQQQPLFRPPSRQQASSNFNQNQRPFNYHAHPSTPQQQPQQQQQVRFPSQPPAPQPQQHFQGPPQVFPANFQQQPNLQRPQAQQLLPRPAPPPSFHTQNQQLPINRPPQQFNGRPLQTQPQFPPNQGPPTSFRPNQEHHVQHVQPLHQHNQQAQQQNFEHVQNQNVFQGGLVQQSAPDLTNAQHRPQFNSNQNQQQFREDQTFRHEQNNFIQNNFGTDVQVSSSVPKFEHHITETINSPIFYQPTAVDMDKFIQEQNAAHLQNAQQQRPTESHHRFAVNQQQQQHHQVQQQQHQVQHGGVSNHYSEVFPQVEQQHQQQQPQQHQPQQHQHQPQQKKPVQQQSFLELNGRNNFASEARSSTAAPATTRKVVQTTTTLKPAPSSTEKPQAAYDLPDEVPDDLRQQLLASGILANAQISILDYDKIGSTSLQDLPQEHLANFFNAGGGAAIGASNKVISVLKPNGDSIDEKIKTFKNDKDVKKVLDHVKKLPAKKEDVNLKVIRFDAQSQKNVPEQYIEKDSKILPSVNLDQSNYNRYLPLKINGAQFPIPDVEELRGKIISSVVVLAPVNGNDDDARYERDTLEAKQIKFIAGDSLKNLLRKPSTDNFRKWLEKEQKTNPDLQSVVLLVTNDSITGEQEIFMYDIISKTVNRLSGELSSKFVDVAEENIFDDTSSEQIDRIGEADGEEDSESEASSIVESVVTLDDKPVTKEKDEPENKIDISSGYSVIKNE